MFYLILFLTSFLLTYLIKNRYLKYALFDTVNERSSHTIPTPHGGGIAITITWFIGLFYLYFTHQIDTSLFYALLIGIVISFVSFFDDIYDLSPKIRLITQAFVALLGLYFLGGFKQIDLFFMSIENQLITNIFAFLMIIWFINLYNFLDGIDGYAGSEAVFLSISAFIFFGGEHFLVLVAAVLGFLMWNLYKAKIFMGDVGSTLLGYNIAIFTIYYANQESSNFWVWIILCGVFWFDATLTLYRRYKNKEKLSIAHKKHAYQRLTQSGWPHIKVTLASIFLNIVLFLIVYLSPSILLSLFITLIVLYTIIKYIDKQKGFS